MWGRNKIDLSDEACSSWKFYWSKYYHIFYAWHVMLSGCKCIQMTFWTKRPPPWESVTPLAVFKSGHTSCQMGLSHTSLSSGGTFSPFGALSVTWNQPLINAVKCCVCRDDVYLRACMRVCVSVSACAFSMVHLITVAGAVILSCHTHCDWKCHSSADRAHANNHTQPYTHSHDKSVKSSMISYQLEHSGQYILYLP